jgi:uncharacterized protein (DUF433 family)
VTTKSLTTGRRKADLDTDIGRRTIPDDHPLITCAPHIMHGHAHLKGKQITIERVLEALMTNRAPGDLRLSPTVVVTDAEVRACLGYAHDIFANISKLYAELGRLRQVLPARNPNPEKPSGE